MTTDTLKKISIQYFAVLREQRGCSEDILETSASTPALLYQHLQAQHAALVFPASLLRVSVNNKFCDWNTPLNSGETVVFIHPVAGG